MRLLTTTPEKAASCEAAGIDHLVVVPFTVGFSRQTPEEYIRNFLVKHFRPERIVIGYDHMLYIGDRPSLNDGRGIVIELNIFDFEEDLYGEALTVIFVNHLRGDKELNGLEALQAQLAEDERAARSELASPRMPHETTDEYTPDTAVVILNYNGRSYLEQYLPGVIESLPSYARVIVADNLSTDDSVIWMKEMHPGVELIELPENYGFANGYNMAMMQVEAEIYVLLNSDVRVTPDWITNIVPLFSDENIGAAQPKILAEADHDRYNTPRKTYLNFRNTLTTSFKNEPVSRLVWWLPVRLVLDGVAAVLFLTQGNVAHIASIFRAHLHFYSHFGLWLNRRRERREQILAAKIGGDRTEIGRIADSIILHYYLLGHRRFAEVYREQIMVGEVER